MRSVGSTYKFTDRKSGETFVVKDSEKNFKALVNNADVREGIQCDACNCAIALAVKKNRKVDADGVRIGAGIALVRFVGDPHWTRFILKNTDRRMAKAFDLAKVFLPGTYTLLAPTGSKKIGARSGKPSGTTTRKGTARTVFGSAQIRGVFWPSPEDGE